MLKVFLTAGAIGLTSILWAQSDSAVFYLQKGLEEKNKGRRMESLKHFEKAYGYQKTPETTGELAAAYLDLRRYALAKQKFEELENMGTKNETNAKQLMLITFNMRQFDETIKWAQELKKRNNAEKTAYYIGKAYYEKEDLGNAIKYLDLAGKEDPANAEVPYTIARAYADMQNFKLAIPYFEKAVSLKPAESRWLYEFALIHYAAFNEKESLKYMLLAAEKGYKKDNEYMQNLSTAYINAGQLEEGIGALKELLQRRPTDLALQNSIAEAYYDAKKYDEAITHWDNMLQQNKTNADALYMIGMCYQKKGDVAKGRSLCDKAIEMDPALQSLKQEKKMPGMR